MKYAVLIIAVVLFSSIAFAQSPLDSVGGLAGTVLSLNPLLMLVLGVVLFFAASLARIVGIVLVVIGIIGLILTVL